MQLCIALSSINFFNIGLVTQIIEKTEKKIGKTPTYWERKSPGLTGLFNVFDHALSSCLYLIDTRFCLKFLLLSIKKKCSSKSLKHLIQESEI